MSTSKGYTKGEGSRLLGLTMLGLQGVPTCPVQESMFDGRRQLSQVGSIRFRVDKPRGQGVEHFGGGVER